MGRNLGIYRLRAELDGGTVNETWETCGRERPGLEAPVWDDEADLFGTMLFQWTEGNYSCDCNRMLFLARERGEDSGPELVCGDTIMLHKLTAIRPDGSEVVLFADKDATS